MTMDSHALRFALLAMFPLLAANLHKGLADDPRVARALALAAEIEPATIEEQVRLCEIPAPPFMEAERAAFYKLRFEALGLRDVRIDAEGNVIGVRPGRSATPLVVFSAHLDTVFPEGTDTRVRREGPVLKAPGIADNCRGLALLLGVVRVLGETAIETEGTIVFVGTVGEEGLGDLRGVKHLFQRELAGRITHFVAMDGTGLGTVSGAVGSKRYRVTFRAAGGHSYGAFGLVNPIHALGRAIAKISNIEVPRDPFTTFNVGRIEGGTSVNSIPHAAWMEVDMRSADPGELAKVEAKFHAAVAGAMAEENEFWSTRARVPYAIMTNRAQPVRAEVELVGDRPTGSVPADSPILAAVRRADAALGIESRFGPGSTDSNVPISLGIPAVTLRCGGDGIGNHALDEQFDTTNSHRGTQRALLALLEIAGVLVAD